MFKLITLGHVAGHREKPACRTIIERRENSAATIYGNALDFSVSKDGYVKDVTQFGSLDVGNSLLQVQTANGTDLCFAAYRPGSCSVCRFLLVSL